MPEDAGATRDQLPQRMALVASRSGLRSFASAHDDPNGPLLDGPRHFLQNEPPNGPTHMRNCFLRARGWRVAVPADALRLQVRWLQIDVWSWSDGNDNLRERAGPHVGCVLFTTVGVHRKKHIRRLAGSLNGDGGSGGGYGRGGYHTPVRMGVALGRHSSY